MGRKKVEVNPERGKRLKKLIDESGETQVSVAKILNISPVHLNNILNSERKNLTEDLAYAAAQHFSSPDKHININWLLGFERWETIEERNRDLNAAIKNHYKPLELAEMLISSNGYKICGEQPLVGIALLSPSGNMRLLSSKDYMKLLQSVNDSLREKLSLIFVGTPIE